MNSRKTRFKRGTLGKLLSPQRQRQAVIHIVQKLDISERKICNYLGIHRTTKRYIPKKLDNEDELRKDIVRLAEKYGRYGYRRITALLKAEGWRVNHKRVERIWREEGLRVPQKQEKRGRLYFNDGYSYRRLYNEFRPHSSLNYAPPAPMAKVMPLKKCQKLTLALDQRLGA